MLTTSRCSQLTPKAGYWAKRLLQINRQFPTLFLPRLILCICRRRRGRSEKSRWVRRQVKLTWLLPRRLTERLPFKDKFTKSKPSLRDQVMYSICHFDMGFRIFNYIESTRSWSRVCSCWDSTWETFRRPYLIVKAIRILLPGFLPGPGSVPLLDTRFEWRWDGLDDAISTHREALQAIPDDHPDRPTHLRRLWIKLKDKAWQTGKLADYESAIQVGHATLNSIEESHPDRGEYLHDMANHFTTMASDFTKLVADWEEAVHFERMAVDATPDGHPERLRYLKSLGDKLLRKYSRTKAMPDLDDCIQIRQAAVNARPEHDLDRMPDLSRLVEVLRLRFDRRGDPSDLDEALHFVKQIGNDVFNEKTHREIYLHPLANILRAKYEITKDATYLEEAIRIQRAIVDGTHESSPDRFEYIHTLAVTMHVRFESSRALSDINEAIRLMREINDPASGEHHLGSLAYFLSCRYDLTGEKADMTEAISCYQVAMQESNESVPNRIIATRNILRLSAKTSDWDRAYEPLCIAIDLISQLMPRSLQVSDKQYLLGGQAIAGLASDAAALSLQLDKGPLAALDFLEKGRGVLATSLVDLRTDISELRKAYPQLAEQFTHLRDELERLAPHGQLQSNDDSPIQQRERYRHFEAGNNMDQLIIEIRKQPGFHNFLQTPNEAEIRAAAKHGPIVVINTTKHRFDAIIVEQHQIRCIRLPDLTYADLNIKAESRDLGSPETLEWLWDVVAQPILHALGFIEPSAGDDWPHIWWIPTGQLSKFPLHAAGYHRNGSTESVMDRVMSSYGSSVTAIIRGRRHDKRGNTSPGSSRALLVAMQHTKEASVSALPFAGTEIAMLRDLLRSMNVNTVEPGQRKKDIVSQLPSCDMFHFAGHGHTHDDPLMSRLLLGEEKSEPLTVNDLLEMNISEHSPFLAYLSACGTGRITFDNFIDESIHLVSACQLAGYRHVIGTLWEVNDELCVDIARLTYEGIRDGGMTDESVCRGLHNGLRELRNRWLGMRGKVRGKSSMNMVKPPVLREQVGSEMLRDVIVVDEDHDAEGMLQWVPYVHYGV
ncbi:CHAT domain-containing protein [Dactylonectria macrodidyma]|uniref:CHAT domain-containing protein n=1 Tax=Dactylonectria macrodidyma TaxID=307937 RepID=A0A9P9DJ87_9HYPO|nr:CHAT domain-containing protein [Dactylonectria macrodidyma]